MNRFPLALSATALLVRLAATCAVLWAWAYGIALLWDAACRHLPQALAQ